MGRLIGSFMDDNELDRPDLNKCPDCECYFPQDNCPICGKECPEEMRAGNRVVKKTKRMRNGRSTAVQYVEWYHKWWFIILMLFVFPIMGIILLATSPHNKVLKGILITFAILYFVLPYFGFGFGALGGLLSNTFDKPVDTSLSYEEYKDKCDEIALDGYFREPDKYKGRFICGEFTVKSYVFDTVGKYNGEKYNDYYICRGIGTDGKEYSFFVRACIVKGVKNLTADDVVTVYGECAGSMELYDPEADKYLSGVCINAAYFELEK